VLVSHHTPLILPILNHYLRALLLPLIVNVLDFLGWALPWLLLLSIVKTVGLALLSHWSMRSIRWLVAAIILVLVASWVLVKHFASTMHRVRDAINLLLILSSQTIIVARLLGSLRLVMTWVLLRLLSHIIAYHVNATIYQLGLALLLSLVDTCLS
jgi:hypothetical protein